MSNETIPAQSELAKSREAKRSVDIAERGEAIHEQTARIAGKILERALKSSRQFDVTNNEENTIDTSHIDREGGHITINKVVDGQKVSTYIGAFKTDRSGNSDTYAIEKSAKDEQGNNRKISIAGTRLPKSTYAYNRRSMETPELGRKVFDDKEVIPAAAKVLESARNDLAEREKAIDESAKKQMDEIAKL